MYIRAGRKLKIFNFSPGHVDSAVTHKNNEENTKESSFQLKTSCKFDILVYKGVNSKIQRENGISSFFFILNLCINESDRYSSLDTHIGISNYIYDI